MDKLELLMALYEDNVKLMERIDAIVRYVKGADYIDRNTILLIAEEEEENERQD